MSKKSQDYKNPIFLHLDLTKFKTDKCNNPNPHDAKKCSKYHFPSEKRRSQRGYFYQKSLCINKDVCADEGCAFAHNFVEQIYHSDSYKKKYCKDFIEKCICKYEEFCAMAHSDLELKIVPLHLLTVDKNFLLFSFKSEFCPFSKINHDRFKCVYAHNWQDFKRPYSENIKAIVCKSWDKNKEILEYEQGCERGFDCQLCHGWKELEYHLVNFKKTPCKMAKNCDRKEICSFTHGDTEVESQKGHDEFFYPVDKNIDYACLSTGEYLKTIDVPVNLQPLSNQSGNGDNSSLHFQAKAFDLKMNLPEENEQEEEVGLEKMLFGVIDNSKQRFSEKKIVMAQKVQRTGDNLRIFSSEKNIKPASSFKIPANESKVSFDKYSPFNALVNFEKNRKKGTNTNIQENNDEDSSENDSAAM